MLNPDTLGATTVMSQGRNQSVVATPRDDGGVRWLADAGAIASIGTVGDSYDNAQIESLIGLYKLECVRHEGPWRGVDDLDSPP